MSAAPATLQSILPDLATSLGRSACQATGHDIRAVTIAIDADAGDDLSIILGVFNLSPATLLLLLATVQAMLQRGQAEVVVRHDGHEVGRYGGKPS